MSHMTAEANAMMTLEQRENNARAAEKPVAVKLPAGVYEGQFIKANIRIEQTEIFNNGRRNPYYGLETAGLQYQLFDVPSADGFSLRTASNWLNISAAQRLRENGSPEAPTKLYSLITKALGLGIVPVSDVVAKAVDGPRFTFTVGKNGFIDNIEAA